MSNLTNAESYTWQIIQENYEKIPQLSISELAELLMFLSQLSIEQ